MERSEGKGVWRKSEREEEWWKMVEEEEEERRERKKAGEGRGEGKREE